MRIKSAIQTTLLCVFLVGTLVACNTFSKILDSSAEIIEQESKKDETLPQDEIPATQTPLPSQENAIGTQVALSVQETMKAYQPTYTATQTFAPRPTRTETAEATAPLPVITASPVATKVPINEARYKGFSITLPQGLGYSWTAEEVEQSSDPNGPQTSHYIFHLNTSQENANIRKAKIYILPLDDYVEDNAWHYHIEELDNYRVSGDFSQLSPYDFLPFPRLFSGTQSFRSKIKAIAFQNGSGIRFLTAYENDLMPMHTNSLFYAFVGVTNDKNYLVAGVIPIFRSPLPQNTDYPNDYDSIITRYDQHISEGVQLLNETQDKDFGPNLEWIDALFKSMNLKQQ